MKKDTRALALLIIGIVAMLFVSQGISAQRSMTGEAVSLERKAN